MSELWHIALIDSGAAPGAAVRAAAACRFVDTGSGVATLPIAADTIGHGTRIAAIVAAARTAAPPLIAQVFDGRRTTTAAAVAEAVRWASAAGANLIHLSLGLRQDRDVLAGAIADAVGRGCLVVAAAPARGAEPFPAAYPGVIKASGDARCGRGDISALAPARFGACPRTTGPPGSGGASVAAAHLTRFLVERIAPGTTFEAACAQLAAMARFHGPERRSAQGALTRPEAAAASRTATSGSESAG